MNNEVSGEIRRDEKGRFLKGYSGNPPGRPVDAPMFALNQAIRIYRKHKKKDVMYHFVEQAFLDNKVLIALMKKVIADKVSGEFKGEGLGDTNIIIFNGSKQTGESLIDRIKNNSKRISE